MAILKRIPLTHKAFARVGAWWKGWVSRRQASSDPPPDAVKLLERVGQVQKLHPSQDFASGLLLFGIPADDDLLLISSERQLLRAEQLPDRLKLEKRGFDLCRFSREGIFRFLGGETAMGPTLLRDLEAFFRRFVVFRDARLPLLLAT